MDKTTPNGFTLIELLVVIAIISTLVTVVYVAVDPAKRFADARNAKRFSEVGSVLEALLKYQVDYRGFLPKDGNVGLIDSDPATAQIIGSDKIGCDTGCPAAGVTLPACVDLEKVLVDNYLATMPVDEVGGTKGKTLFYVNKSTNGRLKIGSCAAENGVVVSTQR